MTDLERAKHRIAFESPQHAPMVLAYIEMLENEIESLRKVEPKSKRYGRVRPGFTRT